LTSEQGVVFESLARAIVGQTTAQRTVVLGGPGTGKSFLVKKIIERFGRQVRVSAFMGQVASLLGGGTIHSTFSLQPQSRRKRNRTASNFTDNVPIEKLIRLRKNFKGVRLLVIDEVSQLWGNLLDQIDSRCRLIQDNDEPFGNMSVLLCGDFLQIPPVAQRPLYECCGEAFPQFTVTELHQQQRSRDPEHTENIRRMRDLTQELPFGNVNFDAYKPLSLADGDTFIDATHVVEFNIVRSAINSWKARNFADRQKERLVRWRVPVPTIDKGFDHSNLPSVLRQLLLEHDRFELEEVFVKGAPVFLRSNICPAIGLSNGSSGVLKSFGYYDAERAFDIRKFISDHPDDNALLLPVPPDFFIVDMDNGLKDVPLFRVTDENKELRLHNSFFSMAPLNCELAFAVTFHKVQGRTIQKVVLHLSPDIDYRALHVGMTRVRDRDDMRLYTADNEVVETLKKKLRVPPALAQFLRTKNCDGIPRRPEQQRATVTNLGDANPSSIRAKRSRKT
jgi:ATP-dependent exoDNAse (exonuclease V) alpha subunit